MVSIPSHLLLFGVIILTNGETDKAPGDLLQTLSNLKSKFGLTFGHIGGLRNALDKFKQSHPGNHYIEENPPSPPLGTTPSVLTIKEKFNLLAAEQKLQMIQAEKRKREKQKAKVLKGKEMQNYNGNYNFNAGHPIGLMQTFGTPQQAGPMKSYDYQPQPNNMQEY